jgi:hypothetical protein
MKFTLSPVDVDLAPSAGRGASFNLAQHHALPRDFISTNSVFQESKERGITHPTRRTACICIMLNTLPTRSIITSEQREGIQNDSEEICLLLDRF